MLKIPIIALALAAVLSIMAAPPGPGPPPAPAQASPELPAPANVPAADSASPGAVTVSWDAVDGAPLYRIG